MEKQVTVSIREGLLALIYLFCIIVPCITYAKQPKASCRFLVDSLYLAEPCTLRISIQIPPGSRLELNDGIAAFYPFVLLESFSQDPIRKGEVDWHVHEYVLQSFVVGEIEEFSLSFSVVHQRDTQEFVLACTPPPYASILKNVHTDSLKFAYKQEFIPLLSPPNYYEFLGKGSLVLLVMGILYFLFKRPLQKVSQFLNIRREWNSFHREWAANRERLGQPDVFISAMNRHWKQYLDPDDHLHLQSLSTTELARRIQKISFISPEDRRILLSATQLEDEIIHAGRVADLRILKESYQNIFPILQKAYRYRNKREEYLGENSPES